MNQNKGVVIGVVGAIVVVALALWWMSANQWLDSSTNFFGFGKKATTTESVSNNGATSTGSVSGVNRVDRTGSDVASIAKSISGSATFGSWLASTGVAAQLTGKGPYTIFVPTDGSISQLPAGTYSNLSAAEKKRLVQYHVVSGRAIDVDASNTGTIQALSKDALNFSYTATKIPMVNSAIIVAEYKGSNGVVYVIDNVLVPPKKTQ